MHLCTGFYPKDRWITQTCPTKKHKTRVGFGHSTRPSRRMATSNCVLTHSQVQAEICSSGTESSIQISRKIRLSDNYIYRKRLPKILICTTYIKYYGNRRKTSVSTSSPVSVLTQLKMNIINGFSLALISSSRPPRCGW
jgi:hypothetical protein